MATSRYAVLGDPVAHSRSPQIHRMFASQTGEAISYDAIRVEAEEFPGFVRKFFEEGGAGLNITLPHKQAAFALAHQCAERARPARAANTLFMRDGKLQADNTDGAGLLRDVESNLGLAVMDRSILLLGAGGAARGVLPVLLAASPAAITIVNRTMDKARAIVSELNAGPVLRLGDYDGLGAGTFDFIINATSMSLHGEVPPVPSEVVGEHCCCYDMMYGEGDTAFMSWARTHGAARVADGLGMLVEQAAESFFLWRGIRPDTAPVIDALRRP